MILDDGERACVLLANQSNLKEKEVFACAIQQEPPPKSLVYGSNAHDSAVSFNPKDFALLMKNVGRWSAEMKRTSVSRKSGKPQDWRVCAWNLFRTCLLRQVNAYCGQGPRMSIPLSETIESTLVFPLNRVRSLAAEASHGFHVFQKFRLILGEFDIKGAAAARA